MTPDPASERRLWKARTAGQARWVRHAIGLGLSLVLLLALAATIVWGPHLSRHWIASQLAVALGRGIEIDRIIHRPWRGEFEIQGLRLHAVTAPPPSAAPIRLDRLRLKLRLQSLLSRSLHVSELLIERPQIALRRDAQGAFDLADVWARLNAPRETANAWDWRVDRLLVRDGEASLHDEQVQSTIQLEAFRLEAGDLTPQGIGARAELSGRLLEASVALQARLEGSAQDPWGRIDLTVASLDLVRLMPWIQALQVQPLLSQGELKQGRLTQLQGNISWRPQAPGPARLSLQGELSLADLHWAQDRSDDSPWTADLQLEAMHLVFGPTTPLGGEVQLATLDLQGGRGRWRDLRHTGMPELVFNEAAVQGQDLLWPLGPEAERKQGRLTVHARIDGKSTLEAQCELMPEQILARARIRQWQVGPWLGAFMPASSATWLIAPVDLDGELSWAPEQARWAMQLDLQQLQILDRPPIPRLSLQGRMGPPAPDLQGEWPLQAALKFGSSGQIEAEGTLQVQGPHFAGKLAFKDIDLQLMRPELEQHLRLDVQQGRLWGEGRVQISAKRPDLAMAPRASQPSAAFVGELALTDLRTLDRQTDQPLVALRALKLPEVRLAWTPLQAPALTIDIGPMTLIDLDARLTLEADGRLNLKRILSAAPPDPSASQAQVRLGPLRIEGAQIDFNDQFIQPHYRARLSQLNGSIAPLLGEPEQFSDIDLRGQVDGDTPIEITGQVRALGTDPSLDLRAVARGFDLPKLSPYSGKWAGYAIEKGSLTADVKYRLRNNQLEAENRLIIDQLTFGAPVASPNALKWPVQLAVSLLKDAKGVIDLDLPIAGSLSDPQFSVGGLIWRALGNLVLKTVSAPFTALASLLRGTAGASELSQIVFAPGSTELDEDAKRRLSALGQALTERPELTLDLIGQADPLSDREALRQQRPRDTLTEDDLRELAQGRAQAARRHLREVHGLPQERMFIRAPRWAATDGAEPVRGVSFELR